MQVGGIHYEAMKIQPFDIIQHWRFEARVGFYTGNIIKYILRAGTKGGTFEDYKEDVLKAQSYLDELIKAIEDEDKKSGKKKPEVQAKGSTEQEAEEIIKEIFKGLTGISI